MSDEKNNLIKVLNNLLGNDKTQGEICALLQTGDNYLCQGFSCSDCPINGDSNIYELIFKLEEEK